jgi:hypothetical protein
MAMLYRDIQMQIDYQGNINSYIRYLLSFILNASNYPF